MQVLALLKFTYSCGLNFGSDMVESHFWLSLIFLCKYIVTRQDSACYLGN